MRSLLAFALTVAAAQDASPNIVLMVLDDVGWTDVGYHGSDFPTPVIDRLATSEGVRLENYYVQQVCSPTRSALMTGRYPFHTGMQHATTLLPGTTAALPLDVPTLAEVLKEKGYSTHAIGKWHLGYARWKNTPIGRGFDTYLGYLQGAVDYYNKTVGASIIAGQIKLDGLTGFDFWQNKRPMWEEASTAASRRYEVDVYEEEVQRILDNHDPSDKFFLYYAIQNIHEPLQYPPEKKYSDNCDHVAHTDIFGHDRHTLCAMMSRVDAAIGHFETALKAKGMWDNTVLWLTSDNGGMLPFGVKAGAAGSVSSNYPLRAGKSSLFQGGVRVPGFVTGGYVPQSARNTTVNGLLQHVDVPTTLAGLAGSAVSGNDGFNVWDVVTTGVASPRQEVPLNVDFSQLCRTLGAVLGDCCGGSGPLNGLIQGKWKLVTGWSGFYDGYSSNDPYAITPTDSNQTFATVDGKKVWFFDLEADPEERNNIAEANVDTVRAMLNRLDELGSNSTGYVAPQNNNPHPRSLPQLHNGTWAPFLRNSEVVLEEDHDEMLIAWPLGGEQKAMQLV